MVTTNPSSFPYHRRAFLFIRFGRDFTTIEFGFPPRLSAYSEECGRLMWDDFRECEIFPTRPRSGFPQEQQTTDCFSLNRSSYPFA